MKRGFFIISVLISFAGLPQSNTFPNSGNVGIGTLNPSSKLQVEYIGESAIVSKAIYNGTYGAANIIVDAAINYPGRFLFRENGLNKGWLDYLNGKFSIRKPNNSPLLTIIAGNGNVGIGTSNPSEKLEVQRLLKIGMASNEENNSPGMVALSNDDFLYDGSYINHYGFGFHVYNDGSTGLSNTRNTYISGYFGIDFFTQGKSKMRISHDGLVSIGTAIRQPGYRLAVNGNIRAKEIKVETNWSDFVFEENYSLPTLEDVEKHIKEKGHLKDIPSAKEVEENGIYLGEMNAKLLQKIEELMLYTIEQQKMIGKLREENKDQFEIIGVLQNELKQLKEKL